MTDSIIPLYSAQRQATDEQLWQELVNLIRRVFGKPVRVIGDQRYREIMAQLGWGRSAAEKSPLKEKAPDGSERPSTGRLG